MNRTDRLYAIVEELRAVAPRPRSATWLASRFEVSARTIERDVSALQQAGTPIWAEPGRTGGYCLDAARTLPPINLTASEAAAMAVALESVAGTPFAQAALSASRKLVAAMHETDSAAARELVRRVHVIEAAEPVDPAPLPSVIADALSAGRVLRIGYRDKHGTITSRDVEPAGYVTKEGQWYLVGWCRLRSAVRAFRLDRIDSCVATAETPPARDLVDADFTLQYGVVRRLSL
ncbi:helix-turn-helix transcriptional regulator [Frondihabitans australicus]|uniref:HTH domain-containing protein n=1 Tax=Frondihabitans australicus TaxID=386892 RepID=A0A495IIM8_9MICO|nr:YafY family protein [Frondihabitans australicus]RKR74956.1 HTH domain-containing protein [Frondihabitans australicus]